MYWHTVNFRLKDSLEKLMSAEEFSEFRLVGGTSLSLQLGHRESDDIDLFADAHLYGELDFEQIEEFLLNNFPWVSGSFGGNAGWGKTFLIGEHDEDYVKLDIYYSADPFLQALTIDDDVRMATIEDIIAMKVDIIQRKGRKKDFWDLHELLESYSIKEMIALHAARAEYTHDEALIRTNFTDFTLADTQPDPKCLRGKKWTDIKETFVEIMARDRGPGYTR